MSPNFFANLYFAEKISRKKINILCLDGVVKYTIIMATVIDIVRNRIIPAVVINELCFVLIQ